METRIIKAPSSGTISMLKRRMNISEAELVDSIHPDAIGLVQGKMIEMVCACDIAEKAVNVIAIDVRGSCPQNMILLAIFGDTASVKDAMLKIIEENKNKELF